MADPKMRSSYCSVLITGSLVMVMFLTSGCSLAMGAFYVTFLEVFQKSHSLTAWIGSINLAMLCAVGPLASVSANKIGCPMTIFCGGLLAGLGLVISSYANNIYMIFFSHGVITGAGYGLCLMSCIVIINLHFTRYRTIAMGLAISGSGVGASIYPFVFSYLTETYGWRGAQLLTGCVTLLTCVAGAILRVIIKDITKDKQESIVINIKQDVDKEDQIDTMRRIMKGDIITKTSSIMRNGNFAPFIKSYHFWLLNMNGMLFSFGQSVVSTHIMAYGESVPLPSNQSAALISSMGLAGIAGRILLGLVSSLPRINIMLLLIICYAICDVCIFICTLWSDIIYLMTLMALFGFFASAIGPVLLEVACQLVGTQHFATAFGINLFFIGVGTLIGAPIAGELYDVTHVYANSLYLGAAAFWASSLVMLPSWKHLNTKQQQEL